MHLGRRFAPGARMLRFARTVGRTSRLNVASRMSRLVSAVRELGPYAAVALILPGGSLIALAAWAFRGRGPLTITSGRLFMIVAAFAAALILPRSA
jgi:hypothetical protein